MTEGRRFQARDADTMAGEQLLVSITVYTVALAGSLGSSG